MPISNLKVSLISVLAFVIGLANTKFNGPIGVNELKKDYGGGKPSGYGAAHHRDASGAIVRNAIHGLEKLGYLEKIEKKGRVVSKNGMQKLDRLATEILNELILEKPELKIYR